MNRKEQIEQAREAVRRMRRRVDAGGTIPDGEGSLFERAAHWLLVEDHQRLLNRMAEQEPSLAALAEEVRIARTLYEADLVPYQRVRVAQVALNSGVDGMVGGAGLSAVRDAKMALDQLLAEYVRIGGPADRTPSEGSPG